MFEEMGGTYTLGADGIYYPNLSLPEDEEPRHGKYGRMRCTYIREHHEGLYTSLLLSGKLNAHLNEIDETAHASVRVGWKPEWS